jgi:hypothetical protein
MLQVVELKVPHGRLSMEVKHEKSYFMFILPQTSISNVTLFPYFSTIPPPNQMQPSVRSHAALLDYLRSLLFRSFATSSMNSIWSSIHIEGALHAEYHGLRRIKHAEE